MNLQPGLPVYGCRDCGQDATCVMCAECFNVSEHKNHNYRISTTEGMAQEFIKKDRRKE